MTNRKLDSLELLRGVAVVAVCFCHFGIALSSSDHFSGAFNFFHDYGHYGVQVFFVVSGFIIPLSLYRAQYKIGQYGRFLYKRVLRLHPPYLVALALSLIIGYAAFKVRNLVFPETVESIFLSVFYFHVSETNPVFWTLVVEAQYYMFIGVVFVWLTKFPRMFAAIGVPVLSLIGLSQISEYVRFFAYINFFLTGLVVYFLYTEQGSFKLNCTALTGLLVAILVFDAVPAFIAALFAVLVIVFYRISIPSIVGFPGRISYSLYLIHYPVGVKFINLTSRYMDPSISWILFPSAMLLVLVVAWFFWRCIELPSATLSSAIKYKRALVHVPAELGEHHPSR